jgi:hypothetical protein
LRAKFNNSATPEKFLVLRERSMGSEICIGRTHTPLADGGSICTSDGAPPPSDLFASDLSAASDLSRFVAILADDYREFLERTANRKTQSLKELRGPVKRLCQAHAHHSQALKCLRPPPGVSYVSDEQALFGLKLQRGRVCTHELCSRNRCGLHVRDHVLLPTEATELIDHARRVLSSQGTSEGSAGYQRVNFAESAALGSRRGHLLGLRVAERMRRIAATLFHLPRSRVRVAEHFFARHGSSAHAESTVHVDEGVSNELHFSSVVWMGESGVDFAGGALAFYHNHSLPWLLIEPSVGRAAFFSSGWENIHGVKPLSRGSRWALTVVFMVHDEMPAPKWRGETFLRACVQAQSTMAYSHCRHGWAALLDPHEDALEGAPELDG